ncbi:MAG: nucleotidyltransferase domain-containing protein [Oscillospiraceae bacterium]|jgi:predicted nucleotidyltransferase|nr:nucleotidyltransferase domain-containing protein [Oscillospiraceae bacterium]
MDIRTGTHAERIYTLDEIRAAIAPVARAHGVDRVWLFGSYARGVADENSDVDLLVDAGELRDYFALGGLYGDFEAVLGKPVDMINQPPEHKLVRLSVAREKVLIYEK